jgi:hypothetical protein
MAKIGQNGEEYEHMEQVDVASGCGPWWKDAPFISKLSKPLLAF